MAARGRSTEKKSSASGSNKFPVKGAVAGSSVVNGTPKARRSVSATKNTRSPTPAAKLTDTSFWDVLLFYPNIIGYVRVACMVLAFYYARTDWKKTLMFYLAAFVGDVVDGYAARAFDQCSTFGGTLDMITDRVSTAGLLAILAGLYPQYSFQAAMLIVLDIFSHWMHVSSVSGHHKSKDVLLNRNALLQWYYSIYPLFGYCCVGAELFYVLAYVLHFYHNPTIEKIFLYGCAPACALKQVVNVVQLWSAMENIALIDANIINQERKKSRKK